MRLSAKSLTSVRSMMELPTFEWKVGEEPELIMCREWDAIILANAVPLELVILSPQRVCLALVSLPKRSGILFRYL